MFCCLKTFGIYCMTTKDCLMRSRFFSSQSVNLDSICSVEHLRNLKRREKVVELFKTSLATQQSAFFWLYREVIHTTIYFNQCSVLNWRIVGIFVLDKRALCVFLAVWCYLPYCLLSCGHVNGFMVTCISYHVCLVSFEVVFLLSVCLYSQGNLF